MLSHAMSESQDLSAPGEDGVNIDPGMVGAFAKSFFMVESALLMSILFICKTSV